MPIFLHVVPVSDDTVFDGVLEGQNASLALRLVPDVAVFLVHSDHDSWHLWPADNGGEDCLGCIVTSETCLAHAAAIVHDKRSNFVLSGHVERGRLILSASSALSQTWQYRTIHVNEDAIVNDNKNEHADET